MINSQLIDDLLLSHMTLRWQKVAMVIGTIMLDHKQDLLAVDHGFLTERIKLLVDTGRCEAQGNLNQIRFSEIRLPHSPA